MNDDHLLKKKKFYQLNFHSKIDKHFPTVCHFSANSNYEQRDELQVLNTIFQTMLHNRRVSQLDKKILI